jgi:hypothetical protein
MAQVYQVRLKAAALDNLKQARESLRRQLGTAQVGAKLENMSPQEAGELANTLLTFLDCVDSVITRAKPAE